MQTFKFENDGETGVAVRVHDDLFPLQCGWNPGKSPLAHFSLMIFQFW